MTSPTQFCGSCRGPLVYGNLFCANCGSPASSARGVDKVGGSAPVPTSPAASASAGAEGLAAAKPAAGRLSRWRRRPRSVAPVGVDTLQQVGDPLGRPAWAAPAHDFAAPVAKEANGAAARAQWSDRPISAAASARNGSGAVIVDRQPNVPDLDEPDVPWAGARASAGVISSVPGSTRMDPAVEHTMLRPNALPPIRPQARWILVLDDGRNVELTVPLVIGRDPVLEDGESPATLLALPDQTRSISKTHLRIEPGEQGLRVTDRFSTNGVTVVVNGIATACLPGVPTSVPAHSVVRFGDRELRVTSAPR